MGDAQHNEAVVRRFVDAFNRRDARALAEVTDSDIEWYPSSMVRARGVYSGHAGLARWVSELEAAAVQYSARVREVRALDERRVVVLSEVFVEDERVSPSTLLVVFGDDGAIVEARGYLSDEELLTQLGLLGVPSAVEEPA